MQGVRINSLLIDLVDLGPHLLSKREYHKNCIRVLRSKQHIFEIFNIQIERSFDAFQLIVLHIDFLVSEANVVAFPHHTLRGTDELLLDGDGSLTIGLLRLLLNLIRNFRHRLTVNRDGLLHLLLLNFRQFFLLQVLGHQILQSISLAAGLLLLRGNFWVLFLLLIAGDLLAVEGFRLTGGSDLIGLPRMHRTFSSFSVVSISFSLRLLVGVGPEIDLLTTEPVIARTLLPLAQIHKKPRQLLLPLKEIAHIEFHIFGHITQKLANMILTPLDSLLHLNLLLLLVQGEVIEGHLPPFLEALLEPQNADHSAVLAGLPDALEDGVEVLRVGVGHEDGDPVVEPLVQDAPHEAHPLVVVRRHHLALVVQLDEDALARQNMPVVLLPQPLHLLVLAGGLRHRGQRRTHLAVLLGRLRGERVLSHLDYNQFITMLNPATTDTPPPAPTNLPYLVASSLAAGCLLAALLLYRCRYYPSAAFVSILGLLLLNDLLQMICELPSYLSAPANSLCLASVIGTTFFRLSANYWLIFITRLLYREKLEPGKYIDLNRHLRKHICLTYLPSIAAALLIAVVANLDDTQSETSCYRLIAERTLSDYVIYGSAFILPNFIAMLLLLGYLIAYLKLKPKKHSIFLVFPVVAIPFMLYYLLLKVGSFTGLLEVDEALQVPLIVEPLTHAVIFVCNLRREKRKRPKSDELTIKEDSNSDSFIVMGGA